MEGDTVADYLGVVRPDLPPALIGPPAMAAIERVARFLPGALALTHFGFECSLSDPDPAADIALLIPAARREHVAKEMPYEFHHHPVWRQLSTFLDVWRAPRSVLSCTVSNVTLEFDVSAASEGIPVPSTFHDYGAMGRSTAELPRPVEKLDASRQAVMILTDRAIDAVVLGKLMSCFELLPAGAYVAQFGVMTARDTDAFRVCVRLSDPALVRHYLDGLDWRGERDRLAELLEKLDGRIDYVLLNLDVAESIRPKIGLECYLAEGTTQREGWAQFLEFLRGDGIALDAKCQAALTYPGHVDIRGAGSRWPPALGRLAELLHPAAVSVFLRRIHHIKLVLGPGRRTEAKAYLGVRHLWVTPGSPD